MNIYEGKKWQRVGGAKLFLELSHWKVGKETSGYIGAGIKMRYKSGG